MKIISAKEPLFLLLLIFLFNPSCNSLDTITANHPIKDGDVLVSAKATFALGFFSPGNSKNRYVGIWYNKVLEQTVVWVANRDTPLTNTSGVLSIDSHGNLIIRDTQNRNTKPIWSANASVPILSPNTSATLLDTGNFILLQNESQSALWQSFDYPSDTFLPYMKLGLDRKTGLNRFITSWKSSNDPGTGNFTYGMDPTGVPQIFLYKNAAPLWRAGSWTGQRWSGVPEMNPRRHFIFNASYVNNSNEVTIMYGVTDSTVFSRKVVDNTEHMRRSTWNAQEHGWAQFWYNPKEDCDNFNWCGINGICDPYILDKFECKCLPGFKPKYPREWYLEDGSGGCVRNHNVSTCQSGEGFVLVSRVKTPDTSKARIDRSLSLKACHEKGLKDCSCVAYTSANESTESGCLTWHGDMVDTRTFAQVGQDLYIRVDAHELANYTKKPHGGLGKKGMIAIIVLSAFLVLILMVYTVYWFVKKQKHARRKRSKYPSTIDLQDSPSIKELESRQNLDLPFFDLSDIAEATNNFSPDNMLGQGGFGSVYKGLLSNGMAIAVKRMSISSGQGIEEFMNEVSLIAKLQHRNLVRILGYCIQGQEKMLVYEYLPNKVACTLTFLVSKHALSIFISNPDESKRSQLHWKKRLNIILRIARGILYLHQDLLLKVIHRNLNASNILLDLEFNPNIADFGIAKIFDADQIETNTNCVVGTYGYISPKYAMEGKFLIKSDVYGFRVLILEIIIGIKNSSYHDNIISSTLVGHVWDLWKEGRAMEIVDPSLGDTCLNHEVQRCIQIGLLCAQDYPKERPTMSLVISMLDNDTTLPTPKQPVLSFTRTSHHNGINSANGMSITMMQGS